VYSVVTNDVSDYINLFAEVSHTKIKPHSITHALKIKTS
jgi:hypothetical protein